MNSTPPILVEANLDRSVVWNEGESHRFLVVKFESMATSHSEPIPVRRRHNIGFVLDRSASKGRLLDGAKRLVRQMVQRLDERDTVSLVANDSTPEVVISGVVMDEDGHRAVDEALKRIDRGKGSNLYGAWRQCAEEVGRQMIGSTLQRSRLIVISDGDNPGDFAGLRGLWEHARALERQGLPTACLGIEGRKTNLGALMALDDGRRDWLFAGTSNDLLGQRAVAEYFETNPIVARNLSVTVSADCLAIEPFDPPVLQRTTFGQSTEEIELGNLREGGKKIAIFRLICRDCYNGDDLEVKIEVSKRGPNTWHRPSRRRFTRWITCDSDKRTVSRSLDKAVACAVAF